MTENWIDFALYAVSGTVACACLFDATRRMGAYGPHRGAVLMFILASAACAFSGGVAYQKYTTLSAVVANQRQADTRPAVAPAGTPGAAERKVRLVQAKQTFKERGALGQYVDRNGEAKAFEPTTEDIKARERVIAYYSQTDFAARNSLAEALLWLIGAVVAVVMGLFMSLAKPPAPKSADDAALAAEPPLHG